MPHEKKKSSTGSWKGNRDKHQNLAKQKKEKKHSPNTKTEGQLNYYRKAKKPKK